MKPIHRLKTLLSSVVASALALVINSSAIAQDAAFSSTKVAGSVHMIYGVEGFTGGNVGVSIGEDGVAMIDNGVSSVLALLREEVAKLTDQPVDYLINTHVHGDHIGNNKAFGTDGTRIISHDNLRASLVDKGIFNGQEYAAAPKAALPVLTFEDKMTLHINGDTAKILHFAKAHTDGDAVIHFQQANVIHTGDIMFNQRFPFIDRDNGGSLTGVIAALQSIAAMAGPETKIIPGHGPLAKRGDVETTIAMLEDSRDLVAALIAEGKSDEDILAANPLSKYQSYSWGFIPTERMTKQLIANLR